MNHQNSADLIPLEQSGQYLGMDVREVGSSDDGMIVEGVANDTSITDSYGTRFKFLPEAFEARAANPVVLFNHDTDNPIGMDKDLGMRGSSLRIQAVIHPDAKTPGGLNISDLIRRKILRGWSIRFEDTGSSERKNGYDLLTVRRLPEISIVTLPANELSLMTMRSAALRAATEAAPRHFWALTPERRTAMPTDGRTARAAGPLPLDMLYARLCEALEIIAENWSTSIKAVFDDFIIVSHDYGTNYTQHTYSVDADGVVTLEPAGVPVLPMWNAVSSSQPEVPQTELQTQLSLRSALRDVLQQAQPATLETLRSDLRALFNLR